ncbi:MAG TPA: AMP-binding protein [Usitatibacter sp.]|nr:AMP-binding protein [Usitatibacter sp.]
MNELAIARTASAQEAPTSIRALLDLGLANAPGQEIVYAGRSRYTYATLAERVSRLASALGALGVKAGSTVAVMDWDSPRYLEAFFAVPMMGAVLHTVNVRLAPEQILHTINHACDDLILVNAEFVPILEAIRAQVRPGVRFVLIDEGSQAAPTAIEFAGEYEQLLATADTPYPFPDIDGDTRATTFYTTGTTGLPKGVYYSHRQLVLHSLAVAQAMAFAPHASCGPTTCTCRSRRCSTCMRGVFRTSRRCWVSSRSIRDAMCRRRCSPSSPRKASRSRIACRPSCS